MEEQAATCTNTTNGGSSDEDALGVFGDKEVEELVKDCLDDDDANVSNNGGSNYFFDFESEEGFLLKDSNTNTAFPAAAACIPEDDLNGKLRVRREDREDEEVQQQSPRKRSHHTAAVSGTNVRSTYSNNNSSSRASQQAPPPPLDAHRHQQLPSYLRRRKKKPKSLPKRPLSAYNLFFQAVRPEIVASSKVQSNNAPATAAPSVGFANLARAVVKRWKALTDDERKVYDALAVQDAARYRREMHVYETNRRQQMHDKKKKLQQEQQQQLQLQDGVITMTMVDGTTRDSCNSSSKGNSSSKDTTMVEATLPSSLSQRSKRTSFGSASSSSHMEKNGAIALRHSPSSASRSAAAISSSSSRSMVIMNASPAMLPPPPPLTTLTVTPGGAPHASSCVLLDDVPVCSDYQVMMMTGHASSTNAPRPTSATSPKMTVVGQTSTAAAAAPVAAPSLARAPSASVAFPPDQGHHLPPVMTSSPSAVCAARPRSNMVVLTNKTSGVDAPLMHQPAGLVSNSYHLPSESSYCQSSRIPEGAGAGGAHDGSDHDPQDNVVSAAARDKAQQDTVATDSVDMVEKDGSYSLPPGLVVSLPDAYGSLRKYKVEYVTYKMTRRQADEYLQALQSNSSSSSSSAASASASRELSMLGRRLQG